MLSMVWQVVVLGTHTVTLVNNVLTAPTPAGPELTVTVATFPGVDGGGVELLELDALLEESPPPPQELTARQSSNAQPRKVRLESKFMEDLRGQHRPVRPAVDKLVRDRPSYGRPTRPPDRAGAPPGACGHPSRRRPAPIPHRNSSQAPASDSE